MDAFPNPIREFGSLEYTYLDSGSLSLPLPESGLVGKPSRIPTSWNVLQRDPPKLDNPSKKLRIRKASLGFRPLGKTLLDSGLLENSDQDKPFLHNPPVTNSRSALSAEPSQDPPRRNCTSQDQLVLQCSAGDYYIFIPTYGLV